MIINKLSQTVKFDRDGEIFLYTRRCRRCGKIYKTPGRKSQVCMKCYGKTAK